MSNGLKLIWAAATALIVGVAIGVTLLGKPAAGDSKLAGVGNERIVMITHGQAADPYWNIVKNGAEEAARQLGVTVDYRAPETFDMIRMGELITSAANQRPAGIIVSIPDSSALRDPIRNAVRTGIPIVSINSGSDVSADLGALIHVGQDEYETGKRVGERLRAEGARKVMCVNQEVGNTALDARCKGVLDGSGASGFVLPTSIDPQEVKSKISAALAGDPSIDAVVALSAPQVGEPAVEAARTAERPIKVASFDMSPAFLQAIDRGDALFAVDQQAYLQGYLSTVLLTKRIRYGLMPANRLIESGPNFVTRAEAAKVLALSRKAIR
jgi:simple sugar transport system substrate-binding protein